MKISLKIISIFLLVTVIVTSTFLLTVLFYPKAMQNVLIFSANKFLKDVAVRDLVIAHQVCNLPRQFTFKDVSLTLEQGQEAYAMSFKTIRISEIPNIFSGKKAVLEVKGGAVKSSSFQAEGIDVALVSETIEKWAGQASVKNAQSNGFKAYDINADVAITSEQAVILDINGDSYKGKVTGRAHVYFVPTVHYTADVALQGLDTAEMEGVNSSLFSQVRGRIYGTIEVLGPAGGLDNIKMDIRINEDGEIQAKLLEPLLAYIPKSTQKENLEMVIKNNGRIRVDNAQMKLSNQDPETVSMDIRIQSDYLNLDVNVTVDVIIEGGMQGLLKNFNQFSLFMKGS